ncbi:hypothetical protein LCGC14_0757650 [marine sediment metagenome]|uniref:Uncharacterized protein n=1 Tax=marine sediment metagenome TaxID=412755 RepID=A0A0F9Q248_9ZZZZ
MAGRAIGTKVKQCPRCERRFEQRRRDQVFCSTECRLAFHVARRDRLMELGLEVEAKAKSEETTP